MWIKEVEMSDGGDGSTYVTITMTNGAEIRLNPDIPHDGKVVIPFGPNGDQLATKHYTYDYDKDDYVEGT